MMNVSVPNLHLVEMQHDFDMHNNHSPVIAVGDLPPVEETLVSARLCRAPFILTVKQMSRGIRLARMQGVHTPVCIHCIRPQATGAYARRQRVHTPAGSECIRPYAAEVHVPRLVQSATSLPTGGIIQPHRVIASREVGAHTRVRPCHRGVRTVENSVWLNHNELKEIFPSADYIGNGRYVFNIKGNGFRVIAVVVFAAGTLVVRFIGTHEEYNKINCKTI
jgi:mRNA interferase HigB